MTVNFNKAFTDNKGAAIESTPNIADAIATHLFNLNHVGGSATTAEQKYMAYSLSKRISSDPEAVVLTTEEGSFIKRVCAEVFTAGAYGQIVDLIEG